jgi:hypothetical protein
MLVTARCETCEADREAEIHIPEVLVLNPKGDKLYVNRHLR